VLNIRRSKLHYTASGIVTPVGDRPVHRLREDSIFAVSWLITKILITPCESNSFLNHAKIQAVSPVF